MELLRRVNGGEVTINEAAEKLGVDYYVLQHQLNLMDMHGAVNSSSGGSGAGGMEEPPAGLLAKRPSPEAQPEGSDKRPRVENGGGGESAPAPAPAPAPAAEQPAPAAAEEPAAEKADTEPPAAAAEQEQTTPPASNGSAEAKPE